MRTSRRRAPPSSRHRPHRIRRLRERGAVARCSSPANRVFALAAGLTQPIFEGGALEGQSAYARARYEELLADYHKTVISAFGNVEDSLAPLQQTGRAVAAPAAGGRDRAPRLRDRAGAVARRYHQHPDGAQHRDAPVRRRGRAGPGRAFRTCRRWSACSTRSAAAGARRRRDDEMRTQARIAVTADPAGPHAAVLSGAALLLVRALRLAAARRARARPREPAPPAGSGRAPRSPRAPNVPVYLQGLGTVQAFYTVKVTPRGRRPAHECRLRRRPAVKQGQLLAQIDPRPFQAALEQARAARARTRRSSPTPSATSRATAAGAAGARQPADAGHAAGAGRRSSRRRSKATRRRSRAPRPQLSYTTITAPIDGRTGIRLVDPGNIVHASDTRRHRRAHPAPADLGRSSRCRRTTLAAGQPRRWRAGPVHGHRRCRATARRARPRHASR